MKSRALLAIEEVLLRKRLREKIRLLAEEDRLNRAEAALFRLDERRLRDGRHRTGWPI